jgi:gentisate 1,2-dioxygenase
MAANRDNGNAPAELARYSARVREHRLAPLWEFFKDWFRAEPAVAAVPYLWSYDALRPLLTEAADLISAADAERRVLVLENPGLTGQRLATDALYAGLQLIVPGEIAPSHRHTPAALRFIIEGHGAYTAVEGERAYMEPGDFIVTPSWTWHEHGNDGDGPTVWLDVLDVALMRFLGTGFTEHRDMRAADHERSSVASPIFSYPYAQARQTLERLRDHSDWDPCHGLKMEYVDPETGGPAMPTLSTFLQLVPKRFRTEPYRSTAGAVYAVVEGRGRALIGRGDGVSTLTFGPRDIFAVPGWQPLVIESDTDVVVFSASDAAAQRKLGVWREERHTTRDARA